MHRETPFWDPGVKNPAPWTAHAERPPHAVDVTRPGDNGRVCAAPSLLEPRPPSPLAEVADDRLSRHGVRLLLKRDDLIHPDLPGNKFRKLRLNLAAAVAAGHDTLLTFGGAYSNHLRAVAAAGRLLGLRTVGVVRGEELAGRPLNPSLAAAAADGMRLDFVDRATYRRKAEPEVLAALLDRHGRAYVLPEGGSNAAAAVGCADLGRELRGAADVVAVACGTGGTLAGLAAGLADGPGDGPRRSASRCCAGARSWPATCCGSSRTPSAGAGGAGGSTTASTTAASPGPPPPWRSSPRTSGGGTASTPSGSTWRRCCTGW